MIDNNLIKMRREFHKSPELGFKEYNTNKMIRKYLENIPVNYVDNVAGTGIIVTLGSGKPHIAFRADMDALPIYEENDFDYKSQNVGVMHACGHDCHIAVLIDTIIKVKKLYDKGKLKGQVSFIFQPCEETKNDDNLSGGQIISKIDCLDSVDNFYCAHVESTLETGKVFIKEGALTAAIDRFDVTVGGKSGHGAYPHNTIDPIWLSVNAIQMINTLESRVVDTSFPSVISICTFNSGKIWNAIPETATFSGTIRTFNENERSKIYSKFKNCLNSITEFGGNYDLKYLKGNPSVINDSKECEIVRNAAKKVLGEEYISSINIQMGGDDFSYYAIKKPSCYFYVGAKKDEISRQHHSGNFDIDESVLSKMVDIYVEIVKEKLK